MNSEEPFQLESSDQPASPFPLGSESTTNPKLPSHTHDLDLSATVEGEAELTTLVDRTLVEGDDADASTKKHAKVPSANSLSFPLTEPGSKKSRDSHSTRHDGSVEGGSPTSWHPLHKVEPLSKDGETQGYDHNMVLVEDDIAESKGKLLYPQTDTKIPSNRTSHIQLDLKPSPQPWDHIDPPLDNNLKSMEGYYSPSAAQQTFHTMQRARCVFVSADGQCFLRDFCKCGSTVDTQVVLLFWATTSGLCLRHCSNRPHWRSSSAGDFTD